MRSIIGCDAHKQFSVFVAIDKTGKTSSPVHVGHDREEYIRFLHTLPSASEIALEATGHWYWMVDEMESAGHRPHLANPTEAKKRMGKTNKTDALDAKGLAILLHNGTLHESWTPPGDLREECLRVSWFQNLFEARRIIANWRRDYNERRPHSSLNYLTPAEFAAKTSRGKDADSVRLENAHGVSHFPTAAAAS